jgi:hypothetical protein
MSEPTLETVLEELEKGFQAMMVEFTAVIARLDGIIERLDRTDRRMAHQDSKLDAFIQDVIDMKRDLKNPI